MSPSKPHAVGQRVKEGAERGRTMHWHDEVVNVLAIFSICFSEFTLTYLKKIFRRVSITCLRWFDGKKACSVYKK